MADVFISYARSDKALAGRVAKGLQSAGFDLWWDADLPAHRAYSDVIERNLSDAKAVVVLWSKAAAQSQWVRAEADFARNAGKLVQATVDGSMPPMPFNQIQCADLKGWRGAASHAGWSKIRGSVEALVTGEERPSVAPAQRPLVRRLATTPWALAAAFTLLVAIFAGALFIMRPGQEQKPVLAVLPFRSLDAQDASLVSGIWEDTRTAIGRNPQLVVLGPNTAEQLAQKGGDAATKAADYLLHASVRTAGDRIRVSADLVRTKDGEQVWTQNFDRKLDDVFALQTQIASEIEGRIRGRLAEKGGVMPQHIATSGDVYALYSDARVKIRKRDPDLLPAARKQLLEVVRADPNYAPAWSALSQIDRMLPPREKGWDLTDHAVEYARKAVDLAPNLAAGHAALALALNLKGPVSRTEIERAVQLDPNDFEAITWLGNQLSNEGRKRDALVAYARAAEIEPLFWPAVLNQYSMLKDLGDEAGIKELAEREEGVGAHYFVASMRADQAVAKGNLAEAANIGLQYWATGEKEGRTVIGITLWSTLVQLGFYDEAYKMGPAPAFGPFLWRNDPKGLDMLEATNIPPRAFFMLDPLTENAGRVYLLSGRAAKLADRYLSLHLSPEELSNIAESPEHFLYSAPLIAVALKRSGKGQDSANLLALAQAKAEERRKNDEPLSDALLARIYAVQGRKDDAIALLVGASSRGWLPQPPEIQVDLYTDPAVADLKGDARFEKVRQRILGTIARERAQVDLTLVRKLAASP